MTSYEFGARIFTHAGPCFLAFHSRGKPIGSKFHSRDKECSNG
jgi:hypothetical protein